MRSLQISSLLIETNATFVALSLNQGAQLQGTE